MNGISCTILALLLLSSHALAEGPIIGRASVIDGDTIEIQGERIRLNGIDAPESNQLCQDLDGAPWPCGQKASLALDGWLSESRPTRCEFVERDRYGRFVGECFRADGEDVQRWLVRNGWALDWPRYSNGTYAAAQADAKSAGAGLWRGSFTAPWDWRQGDRLEWAPASLAATGDCDIKGNINRKGERIYHSPGQQHYDRTVIDESSGERWFCSPEEAEAAGWRPAMR